MTFRPYDIVLLSIVLPCVSAFVPGQPRENPAIRPPVTTGVQEVGRAATVMQAWPWEKQEDEPLNPPDGNYGRKDGNGPDYGVGKPSTWTSGFSAPAPGWAGMDEEMGLKKKGAKKPAPAKAKKPLFGGAAKAKPVVAEPEEKKGLFGKFFV